MTVTPDMVQKFADATGDHQWIHLDEEKARQFSPYGRTIAHGFLTLSLAPKLMADIYRVESVKMGINYGANKIRFTGAVPVGSRVRMKATLQQTEAERRTAANPNGIRATVDCVFEVEGQTKPVCIAELISLLFE